MTDEILPDLELYLLTAKALFSLLCARYPAKGRTF